MLVQREVDVNYLFFRTILILRVSKTSIVPDSITKSLGPYTGCLSSIPPCMINHTEIGTGWPIHRDAYNYGFWIHFVHYHDLLYTKDQKNI